MGRVLFGFVGFSTVGDSPALGGDRLLQFEFGQGVVDVAERGAATFVRLCEEMLHGHLVPIPGWGFVRTTTAWHGL